MDTPVMVVFLECGKQFFSQLREKKDPTCAVTDVFTDLNHEETETMADAPLSSLCSFSVILSLSSIFKIPLNKGFFFFS